MTLAEIVPPPMPIERLKAVIVDIDGTIADTAHRQHFLESRDWDSFYSHMSHDPPKDVVLDVVRFLSLEHKILFVSGRPDTYKQVTVNWLRYVAKFDNYADLFMRPFGDDLPGKERYKPDDQLKYHIYTSAIRPFYDVRLVIDDRDKVVKMWRGQGLQCWQVAEGDF